MHITNGDATAELLRSAGFAEPIIPWRDVLHSGPVPGGSSLEQLSDVRAAHLATLGWGSLKELRVQFARRNDLLRSFRDHREIVLWFEHDLYDQLQLIQVLAWLEGRSCDLEHWMLICIDRHPGVSDFRGLADLQPTDMAALYIKRKSITRKQVSRARDGWNAFTGGDPGALQRVAKTPNMELPFLNAALVRFLEEFPSVQHGLSRTAHHALSVIATGETEPVKILNAHWVQEEAPFMGDWAFWAVLKQLARWPDQLIVIRGPRDDARFHEARLGLTSKGRAVLNGTKDAAPFGGLRHWLGGYNAATAHIRWRWDSKNRKLCPMQGIRNESGP